MKQIQLSQSNKSTLVDDADFELLTSLNTTFRDLGFGYVISGTGILITKLLLGTRKGYEVDHINGNPLDNRRSNLRFVTPQQNSFNRKKRKNGTSVFKGVHTKNAIRNRDQKWVCELKQSGKHIYIGRFKNELHAAMAYDIWAKDLQGEYARLNFEPV